MNSHFRFSVTKYYARARANQPELKNQSRDVYSKECFSSIACICMNKVYCNHKSQKSPRLMPPLANLSQKI